MNINVLKFRFTKSKTIFFMFFIFSLFFISIPGFLNSQTLLLDRFGVTLTLQAPYDGGTYNAYDWSSFVPTLNTSTVDWVECDWYGDWSTIDTGYTTIDHPNWDGFDGDWYCAGAEWYDVEALYFDNDDDYFYIAVVTSVPHYVDHGGGNNGVGVFESRFGPFSYWIRPGDLSLNLFNGAPRDERDTNEWNYNYGVDLIHEDRDNLDPDGLSRAMRDNLVGTSLYKTVYDTGGSDVIDPATSDWYSSDHIGVVESSWEHTNFDPLSTTSIDLGSIEYRGLVDVDYYEYTFDGGLLENNAKTYIIEFTIPRLLFGTDDPTEGESIGIRWVEGCRNDGDEDVATISLGGGDVDPPTPIILSLFTAEYVSNSLNLLWTTQTEIDNSGWNVYRGESFDALQNDETMQVNSILIPGSGTTSEPTDYSFTDVYPVEANNTYWYWIESIDGAGITQTYGPVSIVIPDSGGEEPVPPAGNPFNLHNFPNPFYPNTEIRFTPTETGMAEVSIYNTKGQKMITLFDGFISTNEMNQEKSISWNGLDSSGNEVRSGIYLNVLKIGNKTYTQKMIIMK